MGCCAAKQAVVLDQPKDLTPATAATKSDGASIVAEPAAVKPEPGDALSNEQTQQEALPGAVDAGEGLREAALGGEGAQAPAEAPAPPATSDELPAEVSAPGAPAPTLELPAADATPAHPAPTDELLAADSAPAAPADIAPGEDEGESEPEEPEQVCIREEVVSQKAAAPAIELPAEVSAPAAEADIAPKGEEACVREDKLEAAAEAAEKDTIAALGRRALALMAEHRFGEAQVLLDRRYNIMRTALGLADPASSGDPADALPTLGKPEELAVRECVVAA